MARYAISQEGAEAMRQLSEDIKSSVVGIEQSTAMLKSRIIGYMDELGVYGIDIWAITLHIDDILEDKKDVLTEIAEKISRKSDEIMEILDLNASSSHSGNSSDLSVCVLRDITEIAKWVKEINPNFHNPFLPPRRNPYHANCGSCAFAVESRFQGKNDAVASVQNIGTDAGMELAIGKKCVYMNPDDIEQKLISMGPGSHLICGINRRSSFFGKPQAGHWFNAYYDGNKVYTIDGQTGKIYDWPHDYGNVSEWCALI